MTILRVLTFARWLVERAVQPGELVVDATMGNGHDTLFLSQLVGPQGQVLAYDVQEEAIKKTRAKLQASSSPANVQLMLKGHETMEDELAQAQQPLAAAMFNLGYLPGSDKKIVTQPATTLKALATAARYLRSGGIISVIVYSGHERGKQERESLLEQLSQWDQQKYHVLQYQFLNQKNDPPLLLAIEKRAP